MDKVRSTDQFFAFAKSNLSANDYQSLALLYQPIIGVFAFSLYATLWNLLNRQTLLSEKYLHSDLECILNTKVTKIEEARRNLEAVGLLNAYYQSDCFVYEMKAPMSPSSFINDGILGVYLQDCVTEARFDRVLKFFKIAPISKDGFVNITKSFNDVFPGITGTAKKAEGDFISVDRAKAITVKDDGFDFRLFLESFPDMALVRPLLTDAVKDKIVNLAYVYELDELSMRSVFARASEDNYESVSLSKLAKYAREEYKMSQNVPTEPVEPVKESDLQDGQPTDPYEYFVSVSPKALLSTLSGGLVPDSDLRVVERLIEEIKLDKGVVNVLLFYTIKINDGYMPPFAYYQKIGMEWKRKQIDDAKIAMEYVRHLNSEYNRNTAPATQKKPARYDKGSKPDVTIEWLDDFIKTIK